MEYDIFDISKQGHPSNSKKKKNDPHTHEHLFRDFLTFYSGKIEVGNSNSTGYEI